MESDKPYKKSYNTIDFFAATFCYRDINLHAMCDQADIGLYTEPEKINFHKAWNDCPSKVKNYYRQSARAYIDSNKEISCLKSIEWDSYKGKDDSNS